MPSDMYLSLSRRFFSSDGSFEKKEVWVIENGCVTRPIAED